MMLSVDPGIRGCGVALWESAAKRLVSCAYVKNPALTGEGPVEAARMAGAIYTLNAKNDVSFLALEWPQVYRVGKQKGDNNDLLPLAGVQAALVALFPLAGVGVVRPHAWKGQVPKDVMCNRVVGRLVGPEVTVFRKCGVAKSLEHNVIDALGIGLHALHRL